VVATPPGGRVDVWSCVRGGCASARPGASRRGPPAWAVARVGGPLHAARVRRGRWPKAEWVGLDERAGHLQGGGSWWLSPARGPRPSRRMTLWLPTATAGPVGKEGTTHRGCLCEGRHYHVSPAALVVVARAWPVLGRRSPLRRAPTVVHGNRGCRVAGGRRAGAGDRSAPRRPHRCPGLTVGAHAPPADARPSRPVVQRRHLHPAVELTCRASAPSPPAVPRL